MSLTQRLKQGFLRLPFMQKAILLSSALLMISPLLPWYENRNRVGIGDTFIGVQGPLFLVGLLVMAFGAISFLNVAFPMLGGNFLGLKNRRGLTAALLGVQSLALILIANSVFFHPDFGDNLNKDTRFGMFLSFISIATMVAAGYLTHRKERSGEPEPIEDIMENQVYSAPQSTYTPYTPQVQASTPVEEETPAFNGDPLTLDPKTRYKLMQSQLRRGHNSRENLWGTQPSHYTPETHHTYEP